MRRAALLLAVLGGLLAFPAGALASDRDGRTCDYAQTGDETEVAPAGGTAVVYVGSGGTTENMDGSGGATTVVGGCVNTGTGAFQGGTAEVGAGEDPATGTNDPDTAPDGYAVVDGDNDNVVAGRTDGGGYVGASNYETGAKESCANGATQIASAGGITVYSPGDQDEGGSGSNSGGCFSVRSGAGSSNPEVLTIEGPIAAICGNTTGQNWDESTRDGCTIP